MSLQGYKSKRDFKKTHEPVSGKNKAVDTLNFCVQKHHASRLHYDFRLEHHGVLLSWAVPKGLSLNPQDKRLAIKVEDHPLDYQYFQGTIPKGNYGAGTVEIWDRGTFTMPSTADRKDIQNDLARGLQEGHFIVSLHGEKLNGRFVFQKIKKDPDDKSWLIIKKADAYRELSGPTHQTSSDDNVENKRLPDFIPPMLAILVDGPFDSDDWLFEVKWDGFRALSYIYDGKVELKSRNKILFIVV